MSIVHCFNKLCIFVKNITVEKEFEKLKEKLHDLNYPLLYMFKFILKSDLTKIAQIESMFNSQTAEILRKESSKGAYISITIKEVMLDPEEVIRIYKRAALIGGVISL